MTRNRPLDQFLIHISSSSLMNFLLWSVPCLLYNNILELQWWYPELATILSRTCYILLKFFWQKSNGRPHPCLENLMMPVCTVLLKVLVVTFQNDCNAGIMTVKRLNSNISLIHYNLTCIFFGTIPCLFRDRLLTPVF